jgi:hypothetical protein
MQFLIASDDLYAGWRGILDADKFIALIRKSVHECLAPANAG